mmetsp:Transcript_54930/g.176153  ORF Transcript_54930/g.176153 Transcript_54930/m.176153 type:complete len:210 (+) Transcript_54930:277-906(+)
MLSPGVLGSRLKKTPPGRSARRTARSTARGSTRSWMQSWFVTRSKLPGSMLAMSRHWKERFVSPGLLAFARSMERWSMSMPTTVEAGKALAMEKAAAPAPVPRSATLMPAFRRSTTSGRACGSQLRAKECLTPGPFARSMPRLKPHSLCREKGTPVMRSGVFVACRTPGTALYMHGSMSNQPPPNKGKFSSASTLACARSMAKPSDPGS